MRMLRNIAVVMSVAVIVASPALAQDIGDTDSLILETSGDWVITDVDTSYIDSSYTIGIWAWSDDDNIEASSLGFKLTMSGPHYTPERFDSHVVVDTFIKDAAWNPAIFMFKRLVMLNEVDYPLGGETDDTLGINALLFGGINFGTPLHNNGIRTKLGDLILKIRHPDMLPLEFTIEIDSAFILPVAPFKFSPAGGMGYPPYIEKVSIYVDNFVLDAEEDLSEIKPESYNLSQNTPNPFNPSTTISFYNEAKGHVNLAVYNLLGQKVKTLIDREMAPGQQDVLWDGTNDNGDNISSGLYFYRLSAGEFHDIKKMMLLK